MDMKLMRRLGAFAALAALPATASAQAPCDATYTVPSAQSVASVAERCQVSLWALIQLNPGLNSADRLRPGQELKLPSARGVDSRVDAADEGPARRDPAATRIVHAVEAGETLAEIAMRYGVPVAALLRANDVGDPNVLSIGQRLVIPSTVDAAPLAEGPRPVDAARPSVGSRSTAQPVDESATPPLAAPAESTARPIAQPVGGAEPATPVVGRPPTPERAAEARPATPEVATEARPQAPEEDEEASPPKRVSAVTGTLVDEGGPCPTVRTDQGQVYTLASAIPFLVGTRVTVVGSPTEAGSCGEGTTLTVEDVEPARAGSDRRGDDGQEPGQVYVLEGAYFEGAECPSLRTDRGEVYSLTGVDLSDVQEGERLGVVGTRALVSFCGQGTTLMVDQLRRPGG